MSRSVLLFLVLALHVWADAFLMTGILKLYDNVTGIACVALPMAQAGLISIWVAAGQAGFYRRLPLAFMGLISAWFAALGVLGRDASDSDAIELAMMFGVQLLATSSLMLAGRIIRGYCRGRDAGRGKSDFREMQFTLWQLFLWTTAAAIGLASGRVVCGWLGWNAELVRQGTFGLCLAFGICNTAYALAMWTPFVVRTSPLGRILLFALLVPGVGGLSYTLYCLAAFILPVGPTPNFYCVLAAWQLIYHTITLWPLWLCGYIGRRDDGPPVGNPRLGRDD